MWPCAFLPSARGLAIMALKRTDSSYSRPRCPRSKACRAACSPAVDVRTALDVIDEGSQLRHHLVTAGIVEKHARGHRRERLQNAHELAGFHRPGSDRLRHLGKPHILHGRAEKGGKVVGDKRSRDDRLDRLVAVDKGPGR